ncbi:uncharacterized protein LOC129598518 [Paramacrobiotus metropolitanus]|uniref:uncharacterized protein LOC129598518 n=1 Tax=Paramacrobiotus metropolitanus TaxID=2943436 RepID=UPI002445F059|nr:uncharacterized protein LOC129598518 [Paramacrobiotus metropolitanus]
MDKLWIRVCNQRANANNDDCTCGLYKKCFPCIVHSRTGNRNENYTRSNSEPENSCCSFADLPIDVLIEIFKYFDSVELHKLSGVCRMWNAVISDFFLRRTVHLTLERRDKMIHSVFLGNGRFEWYKHVFGLLLGPETRSLTFVAAPASVAPEIDTSDISQYYFAVYHDFERIFNHLAACRPQVTEKFCTVTFVNLLLPMEAFQYNFPEWIKEIRLKKCVLAASFLNGLGSWWGEQQEILQVDVDDHTIEITEWKDEAASWDFVAKIAGPLNEFQEAAVMEVLNSERSAWDIVKLLAWSEDRYQDFLELEIAAADLAISVDILRGFKLSTQHLLLCYVNHGPTSEAPLNAENAGFY